MLFNNNSIVNLLGLSYLYVIGIFGMIFGEELYIILKGFI